MKFYTSKPFNSSANTITASLVFLSFLQIAFMQRVSQCKLQIFKLIIADLLCGLPGEHWL